MADQFQDMRGKLVSVITNDGRHVMGILRSVDKVTNLLLTNCKERVYSDNEPVQEVDLGLYILRGDNCAMVGLVNEAKEARLDLERLRAPRMKPIVH